MSVLKQILQETSSVTSTPKGRTTAGMRLQIVLPKRYVDVVGEENIHSLLSMTNDLFLRALNDKLSFREDDTSIMPEDLPSTTIIAISSGRKRTQGKNGRT